MRKFLIALLCLASTAYADDYIKVKPSAFSFVPVLDGIYLRLNGGNSPMTGDFESVPDTDGVFNFGRVALGYDGTSADYATFSHYDTMNTTDYALSQDPGGWTYLNAAAISNLDFCIGGISQARLNGGGFSFRNGPVLFGQYGSEDIEIWREASRRLDISSDFGALTLAVEGTVTANTVSGNTLRTGSYVFPLGDGAVNDVLVTNGAGVVSWTAGGGLSTDTLDDVCARGASTARTLQVGNIGSDGVVSGNVVSGDTVNGTFAYFTNSLWAETITANTVSGNLVRTGSYTFPVSGGTVGQVLTYDGAGASHWLTPAPAISTDTLDDVCARGASTTRTLQVGNLGVDGMVSANTVSGNTIQGTFAYITNSIYSDYISANTVSGITVTGSTVWTDTVKFPANAPGADYDYMLINVPQTGAAATEDGFKVRWKNQAYGYPVNNDALIFDKVDGNDADPDGMIQFVNTGNDGVTEVAMTINGDGTVNINETVSADTVKGRIVSGNTIQGTFAYLTNSIYAPTITGTTVSGATVKTNIQPTEVIYSGANNELTGQNDFTYSGTSLSVDPDTDTTHIFGRAKIGGGYPAGDNAYFSHYDFATATNYGFAQDSAGNAIMNCPSNGYLIFKCNNTNVGFYANLTNVFNWLSPTTINTNSTTALLVEQDGVKDNRLVVDTTNGRIGMGGVPTTNLHIWNAANNLGPI
ncbi:MAG: hypothetical protein KKA68_20960, partial [Gammaproteobacteria bacterium]|nr:hypothetical protein [Gammaproteobacteria bacterium]